MPHEAPITPSHGPWIVEFTSFRVRNEKQRQAIESLSGPVLDEVLKIWLRVAAPGAYVVEPHNATPWTITFPSRSASRKFLSCFGGRLLTTSRR
jgi:hypothetical protein